MSHSFPTGGIRTLSPAGRLLACWFLLAISSAPLLLATPPDLVVEPSITPLPEPLASFGAAVCGDWLYVYSGHLGATHQHSRDNTSPAFRRLHLRDGRAWEDCAAGPRLQSPALVAHGALLYRIGGVSAHNTQDEPADLRSVSECACYDPSINQWRELPELPEPRSSHDAVVCGNLIYVAGGWNLQSDTDTAPWLDTLLSLDVTDVAAGWQTVVKQPFQRRALTVGSFNDRIWVIGGLCPDGSFSRAVEVYDPATEGWSTGPELPESDRGGFAASAFGVGDHLYVSGRDGNVLRLSNDADRWERFASLTAPRFFHRLVPYGTSELLIVGGAGDCGHLRSIEAISLGGGASVPRVRNCSIVLPRDVRTLQSMLCHKGRVFAAVETLEGAASADAARSNASPGWSHLLSIDLGNQSVQSMHEFPRRLTRLAVAARESGGRPQLVAVGQTDAGALESASWFGGTFDFDKARWREFGVELPMARLDAMAVSSHSLFMLAGSPSGRLPAVDGQYLLGCELKAARPELQHRKLPIEGFAVSAACVGHELYVAEAPTDSMLISYSVIDTGTLERRTLPPPPCPLVRPQLAAIGGRLYLFGDVDEAGARWSGIFSLSDDGREWQLTARDLSTPSSHYRAVASNTGMLLIGHNAPPDPALNIVFIDLPH